MKNLLVASVAALTVMTSSASGEVLMSEVLADLDSDIEDNRQIATVFLSATVNGMSWANTQIRANGGKPLYCEPEKLSLTAEQVITIVKDYIDQYPDQADYPAGFAAMLAMQDVFPCPE